MDFPASKIRFIVAKRISPSRKSVSSPRNGFSRHENPFRRRETDCPVTKIRFIATKWIFPSRKSVSSPRNEFSRHKNPFHRHEMDFPVTKIRFIAAKWIFAVDDGIAGEKLLQVIYLDPSTAGAVSFIAADLKESVLDQTGIAGSFDFKFDWLPDPSDPTPGGYLFDAIQQIGLKLKPIKVPVRYIVVDHVEKPRLD